MASQQIQQDTPEDSLKGEIIFAGDNVSLAGQIDYPELSPPADGYPLIFIVQHATCTSRKGYTHFSRLGRDCGAAVFTWDKRGTGRSGSGGGGSVMRDTLNAYATALSQPHINPNRVIIIAQNEGTLLLREAYNEFCAIQKPVGVLLAGNMIDEKQIQALSCPLHIVMSKNDWNAWQTYAQAASEAHNKRYDLNTTFYVAPNTNRRLMYSNGGTFHKGAAASIRKWLEKKCQIFTLS